MKEMGGMRSKIRFLHVVLALLVAGPAAAGTAKVEVCHFPPGNTEYFHTIKISTNALAVHLAHGDLEGACNALCAAICDDEDACTVDDTDDCETQGCPALTGRDPVDCDDNLACTTDTCDPSLGCQSVPLVCVASDLCQIAVCAEPEGVCLETGKICDDPGQTCDISTGECGSDCIGGIETVRFVDAAPTRAPLGCVNQADSNNVCKAYRDAKEAECAAEGGSFSWFEMRVAGSMRRDWDVTTVCTCN